MSPETIAAVIGGVAGGVVGGVLGVVGVVLGLFGERWVRRWGDVQCMIKEDDWYVPEGAYPIGGDTPRERRLRVTFLNRKELPVTVWDMRVEFYKGGRPLEEWTEWARPRVLLVEESRNIRELRAVTPPSAHTRIARDPRVSPGRPRHRPGAGRQAAGAGGGGESGVCCKPHRRPGQEDGTGPTLASMTDASIHPTSRSRCSRTPDAARIAPVLCRARFLRTDREASGSG